jgi:LemA protein
MTIIWILLALVIVAALVAIGMYNGLIRAKNRVDEAYSDIDVQAKRHS